MGTATNELGYYSRFISKQPTRAFAGDWIPLTLNTRIGDSSSGFGFDDGKFAFSTSFSQNSNSVVISRPSRKFLVKP